MPLQSHQSIWTSHRGIIILNPNVSLEHTFTQDDDRLTHCKVSHIESIFPTFDLVTIYAPATPTLRKQFYQKIQQLPLFSSLLDSDTTAPLLVTGDFNCESTIYNSVHSTPNLTKQPQKQWHNFLLNYFIECTHPSLDRPTPTIRIGDTISSIDYIFCTPNLHQAFRNSDIEFLNSKWTDHALLRVTFRFGSAKHRTGLWRGNPLLLKNPHFIKAFNSSLDCFYKHRLTHYSPDELEDHEQRLFNHCTYVNFSSTPALPFLGGDSSPQVLWEDVKEEI